MPIRWQQMWCQCERAVELRPLKEVLRSIIVQIVGESAGARAGFVRDG